MLSISFSLSLFLFFFLSFSLSFFLLSQPQQSPSYDDSWRTRIRLHQRQFHWCELTQLVLPYGVFNKYKQVYYNGWRITLKNIFMITSFYYYDQNPSGVCFLVQIIAFVIQTSLLGLPNLNMKGKNKKGFWS